MKKTLTGSRCSVVEIDGEVAKIHTPLGVILLDPADAERVGRYRWYIIQGGYVVCRVNLGAGKMQYFQLQRFIMRPPDELMVDHINGDPLDNRRKNLRTCTRGENSRNRRGSRERATLIAKHGLDEPAPYPPRTAPSRRATKQPQEAV